jgi:hypothetical protein
MTPEGFPDRSDGGSSPGDPTNHRQNGEGSRQRKRHLGRWPDSNRF